MLHLQPLNMRASAFGRVCRIAIACSAAAVLAAAPAGAAIMGHYFDFPTSPMHPDIEAGAINTGVTPGYVNSTLSGAFPTLTALGLSRVNDFNWWGNSAPGDLTPMVHRFDRLDNDLNFSSFGTHWFPTVSGSPKTPYAAFAAYWSGCADVSAEGTYNLSVSSDDDFWLFIDNKLVVDNGGLHSIANASGLVHLTAGDHKFDAFFAQRHTAESALQLTLPTQITLDEGPCPPPLSGVPEPTTLALTGTGLLGLAYFLRKRALHSRS